MPPFTRRNKNMRRPRKGESEKRRRLKNQKKRLANLGVSEDKIEALNSKEVRIMLKYPKKVKAS